MPAAAATAESKEETRNDVGFPDDVIAPDPGSGVQVASFGS